MKLQIPHNSQLILPAFCAYLSLFLCFVSLMALLFTLTETLRNSMSFRFMKVSQASLGTLGDPLSTTSQRGETERKVPVYSPAAPGEVQIGQQEGNLYSESVQTLEEAFWREGSCSMPDTVQEAFKQILFCLNFK